MNEKKYKSSEGFECTLSQMVKIEPEWAVNRIRVCEKLEVKNKALKERIESLLSVCQEYYSHMDVRHQNIVDMVEALKEKA